MGSYIRQWRSASWHVLQPIYCRGSDNSYQALEQRDEDSDIEIIMDSERQPDDYINHTFLKDDTRISYRKSEESSLAVDSDSPFDDPQVAEYWRAIYEKAQYECRHIFDPKFSWTEKEERALVRKLDGRVCLWACIMFFGLQVDRGNLVQAVADNMLDDLRLNTDDYNRGNIIFTISFLCAELPSQLISQKLGPDRWIPLQITLWSIVAMSQAALKDKFGFYITRSLLGLLEGGFIPAMVLWLSYYYTSRELPIRMSFFWTALSVTTIITSLLAFMLLHMRGIAGWPGWAWLFLIEGAITFLVGVASFFMMPSSAAQTKTWFRPNGWFSDRELSIAVNRVLRDDPSKGNAHNRQALTPSKIFHTLKDYHMWPLYAIGLIAYIPQAPPAKYITLILRNLGFSTFNANLLVIPYSVFHIIQLIALTKLSDTLKERTFVSMIQNIWTLPCVLALSIWPGAMSDKWGTYALVTVLLSYPYCHAILVGWASQNSSNAGSRTVSAGMYNMMVQLGGVIANTIYREDDRPLYRRGNKWLVFINLLSLGIFLATKLYYVTINKRRERIWQMLTPEERMEYIKTTKEEGTDRLDFRFAH